MTVSIAQIKEIRERTGAPMNECKSALVECNGDVDQALIYLQKKGVIKAGAKAARLAMEGGIYSYIHGGGKIGVLLEINSETDFSARSPDFVQFCEEVAMQIAAMNPKYVRDEEVPQSEVDLQMEIITEQLRAEKKPETVWAKIGGGKLTKWYAEMVLLDQESVLHPKKTIGELRIALSAKLGENIVIRRFVRWEMGSWATDQADTHKKMSYAEEVAQLARGE